MFDQHESPHNTKSSNPCSSGTHRIPRALRDRLITLSEQVPQLHDLKHSHSAVNNSLTVYTSHTTPIDESTVVDYPPTLPQQPTLSDLAPTQAFNAACDAAVEFDRGVQERFTFVGDPNQSNQRHFDVAGYVDPFRLSIANDFRQAGFNPFVQADEHFGAAIPQSFIQSPPGEFDYSHIFDEIPKEDNDLQPYSSLDPYYHGLLHSQNNQGRSQLRPLDVDAALLAHEDYPETFDDLVDFDPPSTPPGFTQSSEAAQNAAPFTEKTCQQRYGLPQSYNQGHELSLPSGHVDSTRLFLQDPNLIELYPNQPVTPSYSMIPGASQNPYGTTPSNQPGPSRPRRLGERQACADIKCSRGVRLPARLCKRHQEQHERNNAAPPKFKYLKIGNYNWAWNKAYPDYPHNSTAKDQDPTLADHRDRGDEWVNAFIQAIKAPVDPTTVIGFELEQQKTFNGKALMEAREGGRYTEEWINIRLWMLFQAVLVFHQGGRAVYPIGGDNGGYGKADTSMNFRDRLSKIAEIMTENKLIAMNVIEGRGVVALVENPGRFQKRKTQNKQSNAKKDEVLNADRKKKENAPLATSDAQSDDQSGDDSNDDADEVVGAASPQEQSQSPAAPESKQTRKRKHETLLEAAEPAHSRQFKKARTKKAEGTSNADARDIAVGYQEQLPGIDPFAGLAGDPTYEDDSFRDLFRSPTSQAPSGHGPVGHGHSSALWPGDEGLEFNEHFQQEDADFASAPAPLLNGMETALARSVADEATPPSN